MSEFRRRLMMAAQKEGWVKVEWIQSPGAYSTINTGVVVAKSTPFELKCEIVQLRSELGADLHIFTSWQSSSVAVMASMVGGNLIRLRYGNSQTDLFSVNKGDIVIFTSDANNVYIENETGEITKTKAKGSNYPPNALTLFGAGQTKIMYAIVGDKHLVAARVGNKACMVDTVTGEIIYPNNQADNWTFGNDITT